MCHLPNEPECEGDPHDVKPRHACVRNNRRRTRTREPPRSHSHAHEPHSFVRPEKSRKRARRGSLATRVIRPRLRAMRSRSGQPGSASMHAPNRTRRASRHRDESDRIVVRKIAPCPFFAVETSRASARRPRSASRRRSRPSKRRALRTSALETSRKLHSRASKRRTRPFSRVETSRAAAQQARNVVATTLRVL